MESADSPDSAKFHVKHLLLLGSVGGCDNHERRHCSGRPAGTAGMMGHQ